MAGNYPDYPSWRMSYDRDGTQGYTISATNVVTALSQSVLAALNDETYAQAIQFGSTGQYLMLVFPELRDLDAYLLQNASPSPYGSASSLTMQVSTDTTNGIDGTWTQIATPSTASVTSVKPAYRTAIISTTVLSIRALRIYVTMGGSSMWTPSTLHLFGEPAPGENPNRLELWHPTLDERVPPAYFDWGNTPRSSSADRTFRIKNNSATMTAQSVRAAMESLTDTTPSVPGQHTMSYGGGSFLPQVNLGNLAPGAISGPITLRRITPSDAVLSLWTFRVFAEASSWV